MACTTECAKYPLQDIFPYWYRKANNNGKQTGTKIKRHNNIDKTIEHMFPDRIRLCLTTYFPLVSCMFIQIISRAPIILMYSYFQHRERFTQTHISTRVHVI
ncbi:hypothetical protein ACJX0J_007134 [Zea mays]